MHLLAGKLEQQLVRRQSPRGTCQSESVLTRAS